MQPTTTRPLPKPELCWILCVMVGSVIGWGGCRTRPDFASLPVPMRHAHAHNDYLHERPLLDALEHGFCSVEADIHLVDGQLLVAHDLEDTSSQRTLENLYLKPLSERARVNGGRVYRDGPEFTLLIDIKSDAETTYLALHKLLEGYRAMLTTFGSETPTLPGAVTVIVSGNRSQNLMAGQDRRLAAMDGRLSDLVSNPSLGLVPLISDNWTRFFQWNGEGPIDESERGALRAWVEKTHAQGRRLRFWAVPDRPAAWKLLRDEGVDLVNTDDLKGLRDFLLPFESR